MTTNKFRAWNKKENKWVSENVVIDNSGLKLWSYGYQDDRVIEDQENIEITFFTGLRDRNDKEVFGGDILQPKDMHDSNIEYWHETDGRMSPRLRVVEWKGVGFNLPDEVEYWEVIGNIYENKELLI